MTDGIAKQVSKKAKQEPLELLNTARSQITGQEGARSPVVDQIVTRDGVVDEVSDAEEEEIKARARKRLRELEEELEGIRKEIKAKEEEWEEGVSEQMAGGKEQKGERKPLVQPTTKPKRGVLGFMKKKQGTREMGRTPSG